VPRETDEVEVATVLAVLVLFEDDPFAPEDLKNERGGIFVCLTFGSSSIVDVLLRLRMVRSSFLYNQGHGLSL